MRKTIKTWIIIAVSLLVAGCGIFVWVMSELQWDFSKLSTTNYVTNQHELNESFVDISIVGKQADVEFLPSAATTSAYLLFKLFNTNLHFTSLPLSMLAL